MQQLALLNRVFQRFIERCHDKSASTKKGALATNGLSLAATLHAMMRQKRKRRWAKCSAFVPKPVLSRF